VGVHGAQRAALIDEHDRRPPGTIAGGAFDSGAA
jgi:hypothetical protein